MFDECRSQTGPQQKEADTRTSTCPRCAKTRTLLPSHALDLDWKASEHCPRTLSGSPAASDCAALVAAGAQLHSQQYLLPGRKLSIQLCASAGRSALADVRLASILRKNCHVTLELIRMLVSRQRAYTWFYCPMSPDCLRQTWFLAGGRQHWSSLRPEGRASATVEVEVSLSECEFLASRT